MTLSRVMPVECYIVKRRYVWRLPGDQVQAWSFGAEPIDGIEGLAGRR